MNQAFRVQSAPLDLLAHQDRRVNRVFRARSALPVQSVLLVSLAHKALQVYPVYPVSTVGI